MSLTQPRHATVAPVSGRAVRGAFMLAALSAAPAVIAQVTFPVLFDPSASGLTEEERSQLTSHLQEAGRRWVAVIDADVVGPQSVDILLNVDDTIATANARSTTTAFVYALEGRDTFEMAAAHEVRTGLDSNAAAPDIEVTISSIYLRNELWFDPDPSQRTAPVPDDRVDAMSVALHEIGHALAYNGWADGFGVPPVEFWSVFDSWIVPGDADTLPVFGGPHAISTWGSAPDLTRGNISHWGNAEEMRGKTMSPRSATPPQWRFGAPVPNTVCVFPLAQDTPPARSRGSQAKGAAPSLIDELMNGVVYFRGTRYDISALDRALLTDIGLIDADLTLIFRSGFEDG